MRLYISWFYEQPQVNARRTRRCRGVFACCRCCVMDVSGLEGSGLKRNSDTHAQKKNNAFFLALSELARSNIFRHEEIHTLRQRKKNKNVLPTSLHNAHNMLASEHSGDGLSLGFFFVFFCPSDSRERIQPLCLNCTAVAHCCVARQSLFLQSCTSHLSPSASDDSG